MGMVNFSHKRSIFSFSRFLFILHILLCLYTLVAYICVHISPEHLWPAGFVTLSLPAVYLLHAFFFIFWLLVSPKKLIVPVIVILVGYPLFKRTLAIQFEKPAPATDTFTVLSYNARMFNLYEDKISLRSREMISWVANHDADIKCIQEFYHKDKSKIFTSINKVSRKGDYQFHMAPLFGSLAKKHRDVLGVAIFSRYPIINKGDINFGDQSLNKAIYVDLVIKKDTIRVFNVHLHSMSIKTDSLFSAEAYKDIKENYLDTFRRLKKGFITRGRQTHILEDYIKASPYKVIVCGDFNDIPYSYTYQKMRELLNNAFEEAGNGFGFTYNGKLFFLRIDNQFYDKSLNATGFYTNRRIPFSDHFPITATYSFKSNVEGLNDKRAGQ